MSVDTWCDILAIILGLCSIPLFIEWFKCYKGLEMSRKSFEAGLEVERQRILKEIEEMKNEN